MGLVLFFSLFIAHFVSLNLRTTRERTIFFSVLQKLQHPINQHFYHFWGQWPSHWLGDREVHCWNLGAGLWIFCLKIKLIFLFSSFGWQGPNQHGCGWDKANPTPPLCDWGRWSGWLNQLKKADVVTQVAIYLSIKLTHIKTVKEYQWITNKLQIE